MRFSQPSGRSQVDAPPLAFQWYSFSSSADTRSPVAASQYQGIRYFRVALSAGNTGSSPAEAGAPVRITLPFSVMTRER